jgi:acylphosphatase
MNGSRLRAIVNGIVQGVGFRYFVVGAARSLALAGYVRNARDGTVEVVAEGPREALEELLAELQAGPGGSVVRSVETSWEEAQGEFQHFEVRF